MNRRVLFSNFSLISRSGTETFLWDLARGLQIRGWECGVYTPRAGAFAEEFRRLDIPVWRNLEEITMEPDVLHCQHTLEALALGEKFPNTPALFMVHDARSWHDTTPGVSRWSALVAVDDFCRERMMRETGLREDQIEVVHNSVDTSRFLPRDPLPETPLNAAIFTSYAINDDHVRAARELCGRLGIALDELGPAAGRPVDEPERLLPKYDLVFGKARCALEAMAVGAAVILIGAEGVGEMVTPENFAGFKKRNFGFSLLRPGMNPAFLEEQIRRYSPIKARQVQEMVRNACSLDGMVEAFIQIYHKLPARLPGIPVLQDVLPVPAVASWAPPMLQEYAALSAQLEQTIHDRKQAVSLLEEELHITQELLDREREQTGLYRAAALKYKARAAGLKQKLALKKKKKVRKSLWERLRLRFRLK